MNIKIIVLSPFLLLVLVISACATAFQQSKDSGSQSKAVVLLKGDITSTTVFTYINQYGDRMFCNDSLNAIDTKHLIFASLGQDNKALLQFPCIPNDTTVVTIISGKAFYELKQTKLQFNDTAFYATFYQKHANLYNKIKKLRANAFEKYSDNISVMKKDIPTRITDSLFLVYSDIDKKQGNALDSLFKDGKINKHYYTTFKALWASEYINQNIDLFRMSKQLRYRNNLVVNSKYINSDFFENDGSGVYKAAIKKYIDEIVGKGDYRKISANEIAIDYVKIYDSLPSYFTESLLNYAKYTCLQNMIQDKKDIFVARFLREADDSSFRNYVKQTFTPIAVSGNNDQLIDNTGALYGLDSLLKSYKGKNVFIDFWASWCFPCITAIKKSREVINSMDTTNVKYFYISLDSDKNNWQNSAKSLGIFNHQSSFLLLNPSKSRFLSQIGLQSIPRYILINKKGEIFMQNAPAPDSESFKNIIKGF